MIKIEKKVYGAEEEFIKEIYFKWGSFGSGTIETEEMIAHEREHFNLLEERGYDPRYGFKKIKINFGLGCLIIKRPYVFAENVKPSDLKDACLAPKNPGVKDRFMASKLFIVPYSIYWRLKNDI